MARLTPFALAQTVPAQTSIRRPSTARSDVKRRVERIRKEERWADERIAREVRGIMGARYGVRVS